MCVRACVYSYVRVCVYVRVYACMCVNVFACVCVRVRPYVCVSPPNDLECALFALPARLGRLGIRIPSETAASELKSSILLLPSRTTSSIRTENMATISLPTICKIGPPSTVSGMQMTFTASCQTHWRGQ